MNATTSCIKARIAGTAALFALGLAALGGTAVTIAASANAAPAASDTTSSSGANNVFEPDTHELFPGQAPSHSDHDGQGHKGANEPVAPVEGIQNPLPSDGTATASDSSASNTSDESQPTKHELFPVQRGVL